MSPLAGKRTPPLFDEVQNHSRVPALEPRKLPEVRRRDVAENVVRIQPVRDVRRIHSEPNLVFLGIVLVRQA